MSGGYLREVKPGDKLYYVSDGRRESRRWVEVKKVGRIWIYLGHMRASVKTGIIDGHGYSSPGRVFVSQEEVVEVERINRLSAEFGRSYRVWLRKYPEECAEFAAEMLRRSEGEAG